MNIASFENFILEQNDRIYEIIKKRTIKGQKILNTKGTKAYYKYQEKFKNRVSG